METVREYKRHDRHANIKKKLLQELCKASYGLNATQLLNKINFEQHTHINDINKQLEVLRSNGQIRKEIICCETCEVEHAYYFARDHGRRMHQLHKDKEFDAIAGIK